MFRLLIRLALLALALAAMAACGDDDDDDGGGENTLSVVATTTQIADLARNVAGERAEVISLLPSNADAHDFEPAPQDVERVADADLILRNGVGLDDWTAGLIDESGAEARVVIVTEGIALREGGHAHEEEEGDEHEEEATAEEGDEHEDEGEHDPHVWLDAGNARIMVERIRDALVQADPESRETYEANATAYLAELAELDGWIREQIATIPEENRKLVTNHDAFGYYVEAYGLTFVGSIIPSLETQAQPTAQETDELIERIRAEGVRAIFTEASINPDLARQLADEADVAVVDDLYADSLGDEDSGAGTYIDMMRSNTTKIVEALR